MPFLPQNIFKPFLLKIRSSHKVNLQKVHILDIWFYRLQFRNKDNKLLHPL